MMPNTKLKPVELLSPAGDMEKLKVAIAYGADAVYLSGKSFGLRAGSGNFCREEMILAIEYAHSRGVLCYITMNILAHEVDMALIDDEILFYNSIHADALIVADCGIFRRIKKLCPGMEIHISTQASVTNAEGCLFWYDLGARRIVLAREVTLNEIKDIRQNIPADLKLECFIHGAMCMSYSGRCLLSNYYTGRNSNHGGCAQPCRWKYHAAAQRDQGTTAVEIAPSSLQETLPAEPRLFVHEEKRPDQLLPMEEDDRGTYIFNSKDICMIDHVPELIEAGIDSFKIEGRIKGAFYTASTTKAYRAAIDAYFNDPLNYAMDPRWKLDLERTVHRTFGTGFYYDFPHDNAQIFLEDTYLYPAFVAAVVVGYDKERKLAILSQRNKIMEGDQLCVLSPAGYMEPILVQGILDENYLPIPSTPKAKMIYYLPVAEELPVYTFLSREGKKEGEGM